MYVKERVKLTNYESYTNPQQYHSSILKTNQQQPDHKPLVKRTGTTKNSFQNRNHQSSAHFYQLKQPLNSQMQSSFTQNVRKSKAHSLVKKHSRNNTFIDNANIDSQKYNRHFGLITMHCLKRRRQHFQRDAHSLQSQYNFVLKKIDKLQRDKRSEQRKESRHKAIRSNKTKECSLLQHMKMSNQELIRRRNEELKGQVVSQRMLKMRSIFKIKEEKEQLAAEQRLKEQEIHQQLEEMSSSKLQNNKMRCQKQKIAKLRKQKKLKTNLQNIKSQAKTNFKNKWMEQYQKQQIAKQQYLTKKQQLQQKIRKAIEIYKEIEQL